MTHSLPSVPDGERVDTEKRKFLTNAQVEMIDEALHALGDFGEVRLVVEKGRLRFIVTQKSYDALKWRPGSIAALD